MAIPVVSTAHRPSTLDHSGEFALAVLAVLFAVRIVIVRWLQPSPPVTKLPEYIAMGWVAFGIAGGLLVLLGLMWRGLPQKARDIEKVGHILTITLWLTYSVVIAKLYPAQAVVGIFMACFIFASVGRLLQLRKVNRAVNALVVIAKGE